MSRLPVGFVTLFEILEQLGTQYFNNPTSGPQMSRLPPNVTSRVTGYSIFSPSNISLKTMNLDNLVFFLVPKISDFKTYYFFIPVKANILDLYYLFQIKFNASETLQSFNWNIPLLTPNVTSGCGFCDFI